MTDQALMAILAKHYGPPEAEAALMECGSAQAARTRLNGIQQRERRAHRRAERQSWRCDEVLYRGPVRLEWMDFSGATDDRIVRRLSDGRPIRRLYVPEGQAHIGADIAADDKPCVIILDQRPGDSWTCEMLDCGATYRIHMWAYSAPAVRDRSGRSLTGQRPWKCEPERP